MLFSDGSDGSASAHIIQLKQQKKTGMRISTTLYIMISTRIIVCTHRVIVKWI